MLRHNVMVGCGVGEAPLTSPEHCALKITKYHSYDTNCEIAIAKIGFIIAIFLDLVEYYLV